MKCLGFFLRQDSRKKEQAVKKIRNGDGTGVVKRRFGDDYKRRVMLFDYLMMGVMSYAAEVWR